MAEYMRTVYISHPYKGEKKNLEKIEAIIGEMRKLFKDYLFVSPVHSFGWMYETTTHQEGLDMCLWLLDKCDEVWVFGDYMSSVGCTKEIHYCLKNRKPLFFKKEEA